MTTHIGNPKRPPMPTDTQARWLLNVLAGRPFEHGLAAGVGIRAARVSDRLGWVYGVPDRLAPAGRDALARYLYRTLTGPSPVVPAQPAMADHEARVMLAFVAGDPYEVRIVGKRISEILDGMWRRLWVDAYDKPTTLGREALACYLLRGWRA